jgi:hypothetical protein
MAATLLLPLAGAPAAAQDSAACLRSCNAAHAERLRNPREVQVCLVRCTAGERQPAAPAQRAAPAPAGPPVMVAYSGRMPSRSVAVSAPGLSREEAHRTAESACLQANGGRPCLLLGETAERCMAVAEGRRSLGVIATNDPSTTVVLHHSPGTGPDQRRAEFEALSMCSTRMVGPSVGCRVVAQRCR